MKIIIKFQDKIDFFHTTYLSLPSRLNNFFSLLLSFFPPLLFFFFSDGGNKQLLRETIGIHTCDRRSPKSTIHTLYPTYLFEPSFQPFDTLWSPIERETDPTLDIRVKRLLDDIFFTTTREDHDHDHNKNTFLSLTSHGGAIGGILRVVGHRPFGLSTGGVMPILVKAERIYA